MMPEPKMRHPKSKTGTVTEIVTPEIRDMELKQVGSPKEAKSKGKQDIGPVVLLVTDGMGFNPVNAANAVITAGEQGGTPNIEALIDEFGCVLVRTDGQSVGLRDGVFGNSEAGHSTIRGIMEPSSIVKIDKAIADESFFDSKALNDAIENCKKTGGALHLMGLCSDVGVHADINHMYEILKYAKEKGVERAFIHFISDGRDSSEKSSVRYRVDELGRGQKVPWIITDVIIDFMSGKADEVIARGDGYSILMTNLVSCMKEAGYVDQEDKVINKGVDVDEIFQLFRTGEIEVPGYLIQAEAAMSKIGLGKVASIGGRHYYMDRNQNWDRTERAYDAIVRGKGETNRSSLDAVRKTHEQGTIDEHMKPQVIVDEGGKPVGRLENGDSMIFFNSRADRTRQITSAIALNDFKGFVRDKQDIIFVCMTQYDEGYNLPTILTSKPLSGGLGQAMESHGSRQLRISSTEKFAHVTFFINSGKWEVFDGEDRVLIPDPNVREYNERPQMSSKLVAEAVVNALKPVGETRRPAYDFLVINLPNCDMVGHTAKESAVVNGVKTVDAAIGRIWAAVKKVDGILVVTADHGAGDMNINPKTGQAYPEHMITPAVTIFAVPPNIGRFEYDTQRMKHKPDEIRLDDIAPTICQMRGWEIPDYMTGKPLGRLELRQRVMT